MTHPLPAVIDDLAELIGRIQPAQASLPTPCPGFDVAALRGHVLGWLPVFVAVLTDPDAEQPRPDPVESWPMTGPDDAAAAAAAVHAFGKQVEATVDAGVADVQVRFYGGTPMPGVAVLGMLAGEVVAHGWDLARATGQDWHPSEAVCENGLGTMRGMLKPEYRGATSPFGLEVAVPDDATALDRLLGFTGRDPSWSVAQAG